MKRTGRRNSKGMWIGVLLVAMSIVAAVAFAGSGSWHPPGYAYGWGHGHHGSPPPPPPPRPHWNPPVVPGPVDITLDNDVATIVTNVNVSNTAVVQTEGGWSSYGGYGGYGWGGCGCYAPWWDQGSWGWGSGPALDVDIDQDTDIGIGISLNQ
ncbi:MAG: hypothetical protein HY683_04585 [Chloroflexi bacterium]|nr:hypothetical protein [Chloroflexota bacterium]